MLLNDLLLIAYDLVFDALSFSLQSDLGTTILVRLCTVASDAHLSHPFYT